MGKQETTEGAGLPGSAPVSGAVSGASLHLFLCYAARSTPTTDSPGPRETP